MIDLKTVESWSLSIKDTKTIFWNSFFFFINKNWNIFIKRAKKKIFFENKKTISKFLWRELWTMENDMNRL